MIVTEREGTFSVNKKFFVHYSAAFFMFRFLYFNAAFLREGPLENLSGGGGRAKYKKNILAREN